MLGSAYQDILAEEAELLIILHGSSADASELKQKFKLQCPVLYAETGETYHRYQALAVNGEPKAALIVADRFNEVYHVAPSGERHELPSLPDIMSWLSFIEKQCPDCCAPEWPG